MSQKDLADRSLVDESAKVVATEAVYVAARHVGIPEDAARRLFQTLYSCGLVLAPKEPTEAMVEAICATHAAAGEWPHGYCTSAQRMRRNHAYLGYSAAIDSAMQSEGGT